MNSIVEIRHQAINNRKNISSQTKQNAQDQSTKHLKNLLEQLQPQTVALYLSTPDEMPTNTILQTLLKQKITVTLPVLHPFHSNTLVFQIFDTHTTTVTNRFNIQEPKLSCPNIIPITNIDIFILPLTAFDRYGNRIGMGAGFYDRTLAGWRKHKSTRIGFAYECQKVEPITPQPWDVPLDYIVTEKCTYKAQKPNI